MESCERNLKFVKEHLEICKSCERTFRKSKTLRLHICQDHENESDDEGHEMEMTDSDTLCQTSELIEICERNLKFAKEHLEICESCERTFRK